MLFKRLALVSFFIIDLKGLALINFDCLAQYSVRIKVAQLSCHFTSYAYFLCYRQ